jgi:hypothetical protein
LPHLSQSVLNNAVWLVSLILQCALIVAVFVRNIARTLPCFTALLIFYPLRAALLFGLFGHLAPDTYAALYANLSLLDIALQTLVLIELTRRLLRELGGLTLARSALLLLAFAIACGATMLIVRTLPRTSPMPVDRVQTLLSLLMLAPFLWTVVSSRSVLLHPIALGFALQASVSLFSQSGHITAALHRDAAAYARWSYASAAGYVIVVCLWLLTLKLQPPTPEPACT